jgi:hypothetical protein
MRFIETAYYIVILVYYHLLVLHFVQWLAVCIVGSVRGLFNAYALFLFAVYDMCVSELKLRYDWRSIGQSIFLSGSHLELVTRFIFCIYSCGLLDVWRPLRREDGSVIYWAIPEQSLSSPGPAELTTIFYCLIWDFLNLVGQISVFISPRNRVAQLYPRSLCSLFIASYDSQGLRWKYSDPPPLEHEFSQVKAKVKVTLWLTVSQ